MASNSKDPSFPFYAFDWLSSPNVKIMTLPQRGAFIQLLAHCWGSGDASLNDDVTILVTLSDWATFMHQNGFLDSSIGDPKLCESTKTAWEGFELVYDQFVHHPEKPGFLTHPKLWQAYVYRRQEKERRRLQTANATLSRRGKRNDKRNVDVTTNVTTSNSNSNSKVKKKPGKEKSVTDFEEIQIDSWGMLPVPECLRDQEAFRELSRFFDYIFATSPRTQPMTLENWLRDMDHRGREKTLEMIDRTITQAGKRPYWNELFENYSKKREDEEPTRWPDLPPLPEQSTTARKPRKQSSSAS